MRFFDTKEEVIDLQLTPYGKSLLSMGMFGPTYYAFFDDDILYDLSYANNSGSYAETQNQTEERITKKTPRAKAQYTFISPVTTLSKVFVPWVAVAAGLEYPVAPPATFLATFAATEGAAATAPVPMTAVVQPSSSPQANEANLLGGAGPSPPNVQIPVPSGEDTETPLADSGLAASVATKTNWPPPLSTAAAEAETAPAADPAREGPEDAEPKPPPAAVGFIDYLRSGANAYKQGNYEEALKNYEKANSLFRTDRGRPHPVAKMMVGRIKKKLGIL